MAIPGEHCAPCTPRLFLTLLLFLETSQFVAHDCNRHSPKPGVFVEHHLVLIFKLFSGFTIFIMITQSISLDHPCVYVCVTCTCAELVVVLKSGFRMVKQCSEHLPSDSSRACVGPSTLSKVDCRGWMVLKIFGEETYIPVQRTETSRIAASRGQVAPKIPTKQN